MHELRYSDGPRSRTSPCPRLFPGEPQLQVRQEEEEDGSLDQEQVNRSLVEVRGVALDTQVLPEGHKALSRGVKASACTTCKM